MKRASWITAALVAVAGCGGNAARRGTQPDADGGTKPALVTAACPPVVPPSGWYTQAGGPTPALDPLRPGRAYRVQQTKLAVLTLGEPGACTTAGAPAFIHDLAVTAVGAGPLYALATDADVGEDSLLVSRDGGVTWARRQTFPTGSIMRLVVDRWSEGRVALVGGVGAPLLLSADGGMTFTSVTLNLIAASWVTFLPDHGIAVTGFTPNALEVAVSRDDGATWRSMEAPDGGLAPVEIALADGTIFQATTNGLMRSRDMGATWTAATARVAGTLALTADAVFLTEGREIARSTDGGSTWTPFARAPAHVQQLTVAADQRTLLVTTDTGRLVSRDAGATWTFFDVFPANIPVEIGGRLTTGADGTVAVWTNSGLALSSDGGATWRSTAPVDDPGAIERIVLDPAQPDTIYLGQRRGRAPAYRSTDGGRTWSSWAIVVPPRQPGGAEETPPVVDGTWRLGFSALVIAPSAPQTMYAIALGDVVGSTDGGVTWSRLLTVPSGQPAPTGALAFVALAVSPTDAGALYAVRADGTLFASDGLGGWRVAPIAGVRTVAVSPVDPQTIAVGGAMGVRLSRDGGRSFTTLLIDARETSMLGFEPWGAHRLYVRTLGGGIHRSEDGLTGPTTASLPPVDGMPSMSEISFDPTRPGRVLGLSFELMATNGD